MQQSAPAGLTAADLNFNPPQFPQQALADALQQHYGISGSLHALDGERAQNHRVDCADGAPPFEVDHVGAPSGGGCRGQAWLAPLLLLARRRRIRSAR